MLIMNVLQLLEYDRWATRETLGQLASIGKVQFTHEFAGPFSSIRQQAAHMVLVPDRYRARIMGEPVADIAPESFEVLSQLVEYSEEVAKRMQQMAATLTESRLAEIIRHDTRGGVFVVTVEQTLLHVVNHGTFHRGQITCLLKFHGIEPINTDLILWPDFSS